MTTDSKLAPLYLDDLAVGQVYEPRGESEPITAEAIKAYAAQYDPQPFHLDETAAAKTLFGGLAASGWHTASLTMRLLLQYGLPLAGGIVGAGVEELRWPRPLRPGDRLRVRSEVLDVRPSRSRPEQGLAKIRTTTLNQNDEPVQVFTANLLVPRRP
jgi:acyl dehydratase